MSERHVWQWEHWQPYSDWIPETPEEENTMTITNERAHEIEEEISKLRRDALEGRKLIADAQKIHATLVPFLSRIDDMAATKAAIERLVATERSLAHHSQQVGRLLDGQREGRVASEYALKSWVNQRCHALLAEVREVEGNRTLVRAELIQRLDSLVGRVEQLEEAVENGDEARLDLPVNMSSEEIGLELSAMAEAASHGAIDAERREALRAELTERQ